MRLSPARARAATKSPMGPSGSGLAMRWSGPPAGTPVETKAFGRAVEAPAPVVTTSTWRPVVASFVEADGRGVGGRVGRSGVARGRPVKLPNIGGGPGRVGHGGLSFRGEALGEAGPEGGAMVGDGDSREGGGEALVAPRAV